LFQVDIDQSGEVEFSEFRKMVLDQMQGPGDDGIMKIFRVFDSDRNGFITITELRQALSSLGEDCTEDEVFFCFCYQCGFFFLKNILCFDVA
jgi:Ca2+-binding EF-hand superfamily protein